MRYFPIFLDLVDQRVVVVGGGAVAARKVALLALAGASIRVISPVLREALLAGPLAGRFEHIPRRFEAPDLSGACLCIAATSDRQVNAQIAAAARLVGVPVNVVDEPDLCSFIMPSIVDRGRIVIAISSAGISPVLARLIRTRLELTLPHGIAALADLAAAWRDRVRRHLPDARPRRRFWEDLFEGLSQHDAVLPDDLSDLLTRPPPPIFPTIIAVPDGDPDLLTVRDLKRIRAADLILHDPSLPVAILDHARRDADIVASNDPVDALIAEAEAAAARGEHAVVLIRSSEPAA